MYNHKNSLYDSLLNSSSSIADKLHFEVSMPFLGKTNLNNSKNKSLLNDSYIKNTSGGIKGLSYLEKTRNKLKDKSMMSNTSLMVSFDGNLKHQMDHFNYQKLNEILEEDAPTGSRNAYSEEIDDRAFVIDTPRFDLTNKIMNLLKLDFTCRRNLFVFFSVFTVLVRIFIFTYFHYSLYWDLRFNFLYLVLIYSPRLLYILSMVKIFFNTQNEDFFFERIVEGFNYFDNAAQTKWKKELNYDYQLKLESISAKNVSRFYKKKTEMLFKTLYKSSKTIIKRVFLVIIPVELVFFAFLYIYRNNEENKGIVNKLTLISSYIYHSYEIWCFSPCIVLMALDEEIRGQALSISFTLDSIAFSLLGLEVIISLFWTIYLLLTHNENVVRGPKKFF